MRKTASTCTRRRPNIATTFRGGTGYSTRTYGILESEEKGEGEEEKTKYKEEKQEDEDKE